MAAVLSEAPSRGGSRAFFPALAWRCSVEGAPRNVVPRCLALGSRLALSAYPPCEAAPLGKTTQAASPGEKPWRLAVPERRGGRPPRGGRALEPRGQGRRDGAPACPPAALCPSRPFGRGPSLVWNGFSAAPPPRQTGQAFPFHLPGSFACLLLQPSWFQTIAAIVQCLQLEGFFFPSCTSFNEKLELVML